MVEKSSKKSNSFRHIYFVFKKSLKKSRISYSAEDYEKCRTMKNTRNSRIKRHVPVRDFYGCLLSLAFSEDSIAFCPISFTSDMIDWPSVFKLISGATG